MNRKGSMPLKACRLAKLNNTNSSDISSKSKTINRRNKRKTEYEYPKAKKTLSINNKRC
jgi:hypothetical protein